MLRRTPIEELILGEHHLSTLSASERKQILAQKVAPAIKGVKAVLTGKMKDSPVGFALSFLPPMALTPELRVECEALLRACFAASKLPDRLSIESGLLKHLAATADPASVPTFEEALALRRKGHGGPERRAWAIAGLVRIAHANGDARLKAKLDELLAHEDPATALATLTALVESGRVRDPADLIPPSLADLPSLLAKDPPAVAFDEETWALLDRVAKEGRHFEARWLARSLLAGDERPVPKSKGVLVVEASLGDCSRTIEVRCGQSLDDLAWAIVHSFNWEADHLYEWELSPLSKEPEFRASGCPDPFYELDDDSLDAGDILLGELGLEAGQVLTLHFDFGESHRFKVEVKEHRPKVVKGRSYPRLVAKKGRAPAQYPR